MTAALEPCPGCGGRFAPLEGPVHAYMTASPACWAAFGEVLAREYSNPALLPTHRLSVDAYAVQHPGNGSHRARQSVALHLGRLYLQLASPMPPLETNDVMVLLSRHKESLPELPPPPTFTVTVADVAPLSDPAAHIDGVRRWAAAAWADWAPAHEVIRAWLGSLD